MKNWVARLAASCIGALSWRRGGPSFAADGRWHRIAVLTIKGSAGTNEVKMSRDNRFRSIKLRSRKVGVEVYRWILEFDDGTTQDLPGKCLFDGCESRPLMVNGRRLKGMVLEYDTLNAPRRGQLEIWAHS